MGAHTKLSPYINADAEPSYLALHRRGVLQQRMETALETLADCHVCPRECGADRLSGETGFCKAGRYALVSSGFPHMGEEDCLRGWRGSGTIFFSQCHVGCVFCQNFDISQGGVGEPMLPEQIAVLMLRLQGQGCHNINFVTPSHVVPAILEALPFAIEQGLRLPLVYNSSGYDSLEMLGLLDGVVDIYMPDFKFWSPDLSQRYLHARDYPEVARQALREMHRQVGDLTMDESGIARRGLLVRHLVMPGLLRDTEAVLRFLAEQISPDTYVNVMAQYHPDGRVGSLHFSEINRRVSSREYGEAVQLAQGLGLRLDRR